ncbi:hypothetical protein Tco_1471297, partial [Tanacetum coccineum]
VKEGNKGANNEKRKAELELKRMVFNSDGERIDEWVLSQFEKEVKERISGFKGTPNEKAARLVLKIL